MKERRDCQVARHAGGWIVLGALFLLACLVFKQPSQPAPRLHPHSRIQLGIDINRADEAELACIPGVGGALAKRIIAYREIHGPFQSFSQLEQVPGIGPAKAAQLSEALLPLPDQPTRLAASPYNSDTSTDRQ